MAKQFLSQKSLLQGTSALLGTVAGTLLISSAAMAQLNPSPSIYCEAQFRERFAERCGVTPDTEPADSVSQATPEEDAMPAAEMMPAAEASDPAAEMPAAEAATPDTETLSEETSTEMMEAMPEATSADALEPSTDETPVETSSEEMSEEPSAETSEATPEEPTAAAGTIVDVAASNDSFETLVAAIEAAGLAETLSGEGPYTVFAPTDEAFEALPDGVLEQLLLPENKDLLVTVLTYHVVPGEVTSAAITPGEVATVEGSPVTLAVEGDTVAVNDATVIMPDIAASNGVIHVIDQVILPPELAETVSTAPQQ